MSRASEIELAEAVMVWWRKAQTAETVIEASRRGILVGKQYPTAPPFVWIAARILGVEETDL